MLFVFCLGVILLITAITLFFFVKKIRMDGDEFSVRPVAFIVGIIAVLALIASTTRVVPASNAGVPVAFGDVKGCKSSGISVFVPPWTEIHNFSLRERNYTMTKIQGEGQVESDDSMKVSSKDQLTIPIDGTVIYKLPNKTAACKVYSELGGDFENIVIRSTIRSAIYDEAPKYEAVDLMTSAREQFAQGVTTRIEAEWSRYGIELIDVQLRGTELPAKVKESIEQKAAAQQAAEAQKFNLQKAQQEAEIQRTSAQATADAQQILACGAFIEQRDGKTVVVPRRGDDCDQSQLTPEFLQYAYIQAIQGMIDSPNNSTLVLPFDQQLTPLLNMPSNVK